MICPGCHGDFLALLVSKDELYRCVGCRDDADAKFVPPAPKRGGWKKRVVAPAAVFRPVPAPVVPRPVSKGGKRKLTRDECRMRDLCIDCCAPAVYYGPVGGYGVRCERCAGENAARARAAAARRRAGREGGAP